MFYVLLISLVFVALGIVLLLTHEKNSGASGVRQQGLVGRSDDAITRYQTEVDRVRVDTIEALVSHYNPHKNIFSSWLQRINAQGRLKLINVLNDEQISVIRQGALLEEHIRNGLKQEADFRTFVTNQHMMIAQLRANEALIEQALNKGRTVETDQAVLLQEELARIRLQERWKEIEQDSDAADLAKIDDYLVIKKLRKELKEARMERHEIRTGDYDEQLRRELLKDQDTFISRLEKKIDERETGPLLSADRQAQKGLGAGPSDSRAEYPPETPEDAN